MMPLMLYCLVTSDLIGIRVIDNTVVRLYYKAQRQTISQQEIFTTSPNTQNTKYVEQLQL